MKILIIIFLAYIAWKIFKRVVFFRVVRIKPRHDYARPGADAEEMVRDAVCGSYVPARLALRLERAGRIEYFCGGQCRDKFIASDG